MTPPAMSCMGKNAVILGLLVAAGLQVGLLWGTDWPLGVPGEWVWARLGLSTQWLLQIWPSLVVGVPLCLFAFLAGHRLQQASLWGLTLRLVLLWGFGTAWILAAVAAAPAPADLSRIPFVLSYTRSSGYFTQAKQHAGDVAGFLQGYAAQISDSDDPENYLHLGTHPPGLTLALMGMLRLAESDPGLVQAILDTRPAEVRIGQSEVRRMQSQAPGTAAVTLADDAVMWSASLLVSLLAAGACVPVYLLSRCIASREAAWWGAALWLLVPGLAVFFPKSDVLFPCLTMWAQWLWLLALERRNVWIGFLTGLVMCLALTLSLAFAPVALILTLQGLLQWGASRGSGDPHAGRRLIMLALAPVCALALWLLAWGVLGHMNLAGVWMQNLKNHASFYSHHARTYVPWLLENPAELACSLGLPLALLSLGGLCVLLRERTRQAVWLLIPAGVWLLLWLSGKNMGEAARLWIFLMPYAAVWAAPAVQRLLGGRWGNVGLLLVMLLQIGVCTATAMRIDGFGFTELEQLAK
jgi:hypothetical protein